MIIKYMIRQIKLFLCLYIEKNWRQMSKWKDKIQTEGLIFCQLYKVWLRFWDRRGTSFPEHTFTHLTNKWWKKYKLKVGQNYNKNLFGFANKYWVNGERKIIFLFVTRVLTNFSKKIYKKKKINLNGKNHSQNFCYECDHVLESQVQT